MVPPVAFETSLGEAQLSAVINSHAIPCVTQAHVSKLAVGAAAKTHRELYSEFYQDLLQEPLEPALEQQPQPPASVLLFQQMMRDITTAGGIGLDPIEQVGPLLRQLCDLGMARVPLIRSAQLQYESTLMVACTWAKLSRNGTVTSECLVTQSVTLQT